MPHSAALLDVDGALIDTNHHHAIAWARAFAEVAGEDVEREHGDALREGQGELIGEAARS